MRQFFGTPKWNFNLNLAFPLFLLSLLSFSCHAQRDSKDRVDIVVDLAEDVGKMNPIWAYFGYDESNYTYMKDGTKLLSELASMSAVPIYVRAHYLLATGNGVPRPKWSSTNAYTEDASGKPVYDWRIIDSIFDTYVKRGMHPFAEIGFMPKALSSHPDPYEPNWSPKPPHGDEMTGYTYPPADYKKWAELVYQWVTHCVDKYGQSEISHWYWEVWNEPNISYWHGTQEEYLKLYDYTVDAVKRAFPQAIVGGPATTGPRNERAAAYLRAFLRHCRTGINAVTGHVGSPLDFISFHAKGSPKVVDGHIRMGIMEQMKDVANGFEIIAADPQYSNLPIIISEADPEGCAGCAATYYPHNTYRNGTMYSSYTAASFSRIYKLADQYKVNLGGALSWSFEFEDQPWFSGFRSLSTHGVDKPVMNVFRMFAMMRGERLSVKSDAAVPISTVLEKGIHDGEPDIDAMASHDNKDAWVLVWNYYDDELPHPPSPVRVVFHGIHGGKVLVEHYRVDEQHSNSYALWKKMGEPQQVNDESYHLLEQAGQLQLLTSPEWVKVSSEGTMSLDFSLPRRGVSLLHIRW